MYVKGNTQAIPPLQGSGSNVVLKGPSRIMVYVRQASTALTPSLIKCDYRAPHLIKLSVSAVVVSDIHVREREHARHPTVARIWKRCRFEMAYTHYGLYGTGLNCTGR